MVMVGRSFTSLRESAKNILVSLFVNKEDIMHVNMDVQIGVNKAANLHVKQNINMVVSYKLHNNISNFRITNSNEHNVNTFSFSLYYLCWGTMNLLALLP